jgi:glycosyltransferase involved in cell wall biosynthesis
MPDKPLLSVNITTYNRSNLLPRCLKSVLKQNYKNMEIVIVDDCSNDNTTEIVKKYQEQDKRIKYFRHKINCGNAQARNTALKNSNGLYVAFLDDDDEWIDRNKIKKQVEIFEKSDDKKLGIVCSGIVRIKKNGKEIIEIAKIPKDIKYQILKGGFINNSTVLTKKSILKEVGGFDVKNYRGIDSEFFRRMILIYNYNVFFMQEVTCRYYETSINRMSDTNNNESYLAQIKSQYYNIKKYFKFLIIRPGTLFIRLYRLFYSMIKYLFNIKRK